MNRLDYFVMPTRTKKQHNNNKKNTAKKKKKPHQNNNKTEGSWIYVVQIRDLHIILKARYQGYYGRK